MQDNSDQAEVARLRGENAELRRLLASAGIDLDRRAIDRQESDAQQGADLAISRAETSVARAETKRVRRVAVAASHQHLEEARVAASALSTAQALVAALRRQDRRQAALIELGERLRGERDTATIVRIGAETAAQAIDAARAAYGFVDPKAETVLIEDDWCAPGVPSIAALHHFSDFGSFFGDLQRGAMVVVDDAASDPRTRDKAEAFASIGIGSLINVPLIEGGALAAVAIVQHDQPHAWTVEEVAFVTAVADRIQAAIARSEAEAQQAMVNGEIAHRLKNTLAVVQAITAQTLRRAASLPDAQKTLSNRLIALGKAHDALTAGSTHAAGVASVATNALALHNGDGERIRLEGPDVRIGPSASMSLALMLHELATNAAKYGALSQPGGRVAVAWEVEPDDAGERLVLTWTERGGPPVTPPASRGFGSRLIERGFGAGAEVVLAFDPGGVVATLRTPLASLQGGTAGH